MKHAHIFYAACIGTECDRTVRLPMPQADPHVHTFVYWIRYTCLGAYIGSQTISCCDVRRQSCSLSCCDIMRHIVKVQHTPQVILLPLLHCTPGCGWPALPRSATGQAASSANPDAFGAHDLAAASKDPVVVIAKVVLAGDGPTGGLGLTRREGWRLRNGSQIEPQQQQQQSDYGARSAAAAVPQLPETAANGARAAAYGEMAAAAGSRGWGWELLPAQGATTVAVSA